MLDRALSVLTSHAKVGLAVVATVLVTGGSTVAVTTVASSKAADRPAVSEEHEPAEQSTLKGDNRSETGAEKSAGKGADPAPDAPEAGEENEPQGVHGACVSAVARDDSTEGREHGEAVSAAAKSCPQNKDAEDGETAPAADGAGHASETGVEKGTAGRERGQANRESRGKSGS